MVIFRCLRSGNTVSFTDSEDIDKMRKHEGYEEVKNEEIKEKTYQKREVLKLKQVQHGNA